MNISIGGADTCVCENWNSNNPSMVSFVGLESNNQKQFWDWETNSNTTTHTTNNNGNPFINPTTNIYDYSGLTSSSTFAANNFPYSQFSDYSSAAAGLLKQEDGSYGFDGGNYSASGRIGLNLGHRTYFSSRETAVIDRLFRRPRGFCHANQVPRCQAEGCRFDLTNAKHYHRRHKVCEFHSKASKVVAGGLEQRFCQQCSRFHVLAEFDEAKRSCRKRLADHNRRRRKPQPGSSDSKPAKTAENAFSQVDSSAWRSEELKEKSLSSSTLPLMVSKSITNNKTSATLFNSGPALSLGGEQHQRPFIFNNDSMTLFHRDNSVSPYSNLIFSTSNEASQSTAGGSHLNQHSEDLQNLLHLGRSMFEVEFQS